MLILNHRANTLRLQLAALAATGLVAAGLAAGAAARPDALPHKSFYLDVKAGQCLRGPAAKLVLVVACSDPRHNFEVFAVVHVGRTPPTFALSNRQCQATFLRRFGHPILRGYGWYGFWADPGAEAVKYGDRAVCTLTRWPTRVAMGPGTHFRR
jgi:hypothetical protein